MRLAVAIVLALATSVAAQPAAPCVTCARGDTLIDQFSLEPLRTLADQLAAMQLADRLTPEQYTRVIELRRTSPALVKLGALDDTDLAAIASALCRAPAGGCVDATTRALRCIAERCAVDLPAPDPRDVDLVELPASCHKYSTRRRSPSLGLGIEWGTGWQRTRYPTDGRAWSFGIEGRMRVGRRLGLIARVDRVAGRDEAADTDGNGHDDLSTGSITRIAALAGPSIVLDNTRFASTTRFLRLDLLAGYLATRSQAAESGPAGGFDLAYQLSIVRLGVRVVQGFGDARDATMLLVHLGFVPGSAPIYSDATDCGANVTSRSSRLALALDIPISGYGISSQLGYLATGFGVEALWHLTRALDVMTRVDLLLYPGYERDRVIHQAVLAGMRIDHMPRGRSADTGFFTTVMGGYSHGAALTPTRVGSGPIVDASFGWGIQGKEGAAYLRLHARSGVGPDNYGYRAIFLSGGLELRFDPRRWRDRT